MVISKDLREIHIPVKTWPFSFPLDPRQALGDPLHNDQAITDHLTFDIVSPSETFVSPEAQHCQSR